MRRNRKQRGEGTPQDGRIGAGRTQLDGGDSDLGHDAAPSARQEGAADRTKESTAAGAGAGAQKRTGSDVEKRGGNQQDKAKPAAGALTSGSNSVSSSQRAGHGTQPQPLDVATTLSVDVVIEGPPGPHARGTRASSIHGAKTSEISPAGQEPTNHRQTLPSPSKPPPGVPPLVPAKRQDDTLNVPHTLADFPQNSIVTQPSVRSPSDIDVNSGGIMVAGGSHQQYASLALGTLVFDNNIFSKNNDASAFGGGNIASSEFPDTFGNNNNAFGDSNFGAADTFGFGQGFAEPVDRAAFGQISLTQHETASLQKAQASSSWPDTQTTNFNVQFDAYSSSSGSESGSNISPMGQPPFSGGDRNSASQFTHHYGGQNTAITEPPNNAASRTLGVPRLLTTASASKPETQQLKAGSTHGDSFNFDAVSAQQQIPHSGSFTGTPTQSRNYDQPSGQQVSGADHSSDAGHSAYLDDSSLMRARKSELHHSLNPFDSDTSDEDEDV